MSQKRCAVIRVKIQYDKYDRTFKLVDKEFGPLLEDGETYELLVPAVIENDDEEEQPIILGIIPMAHA